MASLSQLKKTRVNTFPNSSIIHQEKARQIFASLVCHAKTFFQILKTVQKRNFNQNAEKCSDELRNLKINLCYCVLTFYKGNHMLNDACLICRELVAKQLILSPNTCKIKHNKIFYQTLIKVQSQMALLYTLNVKHNLKIVEMFERK